MPRINFITQRNDLNNNNFISIALLSYVQGALQWLAKRPDTGKPIESVVYCLIVQLVYYLQRPSFYENLIRSLMPFIQEFNFDREMVLSVSLVVGTYLSFSRNLVVVFLCDFASSRNILTTFQLCNL